VDISIPQETASDAALAALERACAELRNDASWSPVLVDGPRTLGVESLGQAGATLRLQLRTIPGRQDDAARELRRRIQLRFEQEHIRWGGVQRVEVAGSEALQNIAARSNS
jgi:small-conductance mechanosensitive channel